MTTALRLLVLLAAGAGIWFAVAPAPRPDAAARPFGWIGDPRFAAATPVRHAAFSPDGRWLAGTGRGEVRLWDAATGRAVRRIAFGDSAVGIFVGFTPDGRTVLALEFEDIPYVSAPPYLGANWPVTVRRFDAATGAELGRVRLAGVNVARMYGRTVAAFTPDGTGVIFGGDGLQPTRFDTATGQKVWAAAFPSTNAGHAQHFTGVAVSPDGATVAAAVSNSGGPFHLLDAATGAALGRLTEPATDYAAVAFSADGKTLATAGRGTEVVLWDAATRTPRVRVKTADMVNTPLALSPAGDRVAVAEFNKGVFVYDVATGRETARADARQSCPTVAFSPDGRAVAAAAGRVVVLDAASGERRGTTEWSPSVPPQLRFSADGARVHVRTGLRNDLVTYELPSGREVARTANTSAASAALGFPDRERVVSADGRLAAAEVVVRDYDRAIAVTETATGRERCRVPFNLLKQNRTAAGFNRDGGLLYTVGPHEVAVWDTATGQRMHVLAEPAKLAGKLQPFLSLAASPGGRCVAVFADAVAQEAGFCGTCNASAQDTAAKTVTIWDAAAWRVVRTVPVPAGRWFFWQTDDRFTVETVARRPFDPRSRWTPTEDAADPYDALRFSPLPGMGPHEVEEWTVAGGAGKTRRFDPPPRERLVPAPDGRTLAGFDPHDPARPGIRLYEAETGRERHAFAVDEPCRSATFSPDGRYLLTDHPAAGLRIWDMLETAGAK